MSEFRRKIIAFANFIQMLGILGLTIYGGHLGYTTGRVAGGGRLEDPIYPIGGAILGLAIGALAAGILFALTEIMVEMSEARALLELLNRKGSERTPAR